MSPSHDVSEGGFADTFVSINCHDVNGSFDDHNLLSMAAAIQLGPRRPDSCGRGRPANCLEARWRLRSTGPSIRFFANRRRVEFVPSFNDDSAARLRSVRFEPRDSPVRRSVGVRCGARSSEGGSISLPSSRPTLAANRFQQIAAASSSGERGKERIARLGGLEARRIRSTRRGMDSGDRHGIGRLLGSLTPADHLPSREAAPESAKIVASLVPIVERTANSRRAGWTDGEVSATRSGGRRSIVDCLFARSSGGVAPRDAGGVDVGYVDGAVRMWRWRQPTRLEARGRGVRSRSPTRRQPPT